MSQPPIPEGYHAVTPYILSPDAPALIGFLTNAFGAKKRFLLRRDDGSVQHAQVSIGDSVVMLGEPKEPFVPLAASNYLYVADADAVFNKAVAAGAVAVIPMADQFYGDRMGGVRDPQGNLWWIATRKKGPVYESMIQDSH